MDRIRQQFKDIADMIRLRNGTTDSISVSEMPELIRTLAGGTFTANSITNEDGKTQTLAINTYKAPFLPVSCDPVFANNSWETISKVSKQISENKMTSTDVYNYYGWSLRDKKQFELSTGEAITVEIGDFNHDDKADESGKAGITLIMTHALNEKTYMMGGYTNNGGYLNSNARRYLNNTILPQLPLELSDHIISVIKKSADGGGTQTNYNKYFTKINSHTEKLFLLATIEAFTYSGTAEHGSEEGYTYPGISSKTKYTTNGSSTAWWHRSASSYYGDRFMLTKTSGSMGESMSNDDYGIVFAFCI